MRMLITAIIVFFPLLSFAEDNCPTAAEASVSPFTRVNISGPTYSVWGSFDPYHNGNLYFTNVPYIHAVSDTQALQNANAALANGKVVLLTPTSTCYNGNEGGFCECKYQIRISGAAEDRNYVMEADILD